MSSPNYRWVCHRCGLANESGTSSCASCKTSAVISGFDLEPTLSSKEIDHRRKAKAERDTSIMLFFPEIILAGCVALGAPVIEFLGALIKDAGKKAFLILDNLRVHHSKPVTKRVAEHAELIELFYLPSYSPELNSGERLNADLKQAMGSKVPARTKAKLRRAATQHMTELEHSPERIKAFFQDKKVRYAA